MAYIVLYFVLRGTQRAAFWVVPLWQRLHEGPSAKDSIKTVSTLTSPTKERCTALLLTNTVWQTRRFRFVPHLCLASPLTWATSCGTPPSGRGLPKTSDCQTLYLAPKSVEKKDFALLQNNSFNLRRLRGRDVWFAGVCGVEEPGFISTSLSLQVHFWMNAFMWFPQAADWFELTEVAFSPADGYDVHESRPVST